MSKGSNITHLADVFGQNLTVYENRPAKMYHWKEAKNLGYLPFSRTKIYKLMAAEDETQLPYVDDGGQRYILESDLIEWQRRNRVGKPVPTEMANAISKEEFREIVRNELREFLKLAAAV